MTLRAMTRPLASRNVTSSPMSLSVDVSVSSLRRYTITRSMRVVAGSCTVIQSGVRPSPLECHMR